MQLLQQILTFSTLLSVIELSSTTSNGRPFLYTRGPLPRIFRRGDRYPNRNETEECRPIRLRIMRNSRLYRSDLVTNSNPNIVFQSADARLMTSRLQSRLDALAERFSSRITVIRAWSEYSAGDRIGDPHSLHYEGRTVQVRVRRRNHLSLLLRLAVEVGFDWVYYASHDYVRLSVIPDVCSANIDLVFMLDQSGSVGIRNHDIALRFISNVVSFFNISTNATQVGLVTFSDYAHIEFTLGQLTNFYSIQQQLSRIPYTGGWTSTSLALLFARYILDPAFSYGARPASEGIPKIAVLITDGQSNIYPIEPYATQLRESGVQVYTVGIGQINIPELLTIASDPDDRHVFLLDSFNDAPSFVDFLSFTTCETPAMVTPGENTTTEVEEDKFRYFQSACPAFSQTVMIEQIDIIGKCSLYASASVQNPGPLNSHEMVVRNEDRNRRNRSVTLRLHGNRFVYVSVRGLTIRNTFSVIIWDMIFPQDLYILTVPEGTVVPGLFDLTTHLLTSSNVTFNFTIKDGNERGFFSLGKQSGLLDLLRPLDSDRQDSFLLTIVAQNSQFSCHRGRVQIIVTVSRNNNIQFPDLDPVSVPENAVIGSQITQVTASGGSGNVEYSLSLSGDAVGVFAIDSSTGNITLASSLDFERVNNYSIAVVGRGVSTRASASVTIVIRVTDVNERPFFTDRCAMPRPGGGTGECTFTVSENRPNGTDVGTLFAGDPDFPSVRNGELTFELVHEGTPVGFRLEQSGRSALIRTMNVFDREETPSFTFTVRVTDNGILPLSAVVMVTVIIGDENDNVPEFFQSPVQLRVRESIAVNSLITRYIANDPDNGSNAQILYTLSSTFSPLPFQIDPNSGELFVNQTLDFETTRSYVITVTASNPDGLNSSNNFTFIPIVDVNDNPPVFSMETYFASVIEGASPTTAVISINANDADSNLLGTLRYSIAGGNFNDSLGIKRISNTIALISVARVIDREAIPMFTLTLQVEDMGQPPLVDTAILFINVTDINDNRPVFTRESYQATIREDTQAPFDVLTLSAFDMDQPSTPNSDIVFTLNPATTNVSGVFDLVAIDSSSATLRLIGQLDFEVLNFYELSVTASDQGNPPLSSNTTIRVNVTNFVEFPPVVTSNQTINISETELVGTRIARINVTDSDGMELNFTIAAVEGSGPGGNSGDTLSIFGIDSTGVVSLNRRLDFETSDSFMITILVSDGGVNTNSFIMVNVLDVNEFNPVIQQVDLFVLEKQPNGIVVGTVPASDGDRGAGGVLSYSLLFDTTASMLFRIDPTNGTIFTNQVIDREELVEQDLFLPSQGSREFIRVEVTDSGTSPRSTIGSVGVVLQDVNDNAPSFQNLNRLVSIPENEEVGEVISNVMATDSDLGENAVITYSIAISGLNQTQSPFIVNGSGNILTSIVLDSELVQTYAATVTASDNGQPPLSVSEILVISVVDQNDNAPIFRQDSYNSTVTENVSVGSVILRVMASDRDASVLNSEVRYGIQSSIPAESVNLFSINPINGILSIEQALDFELVQMHILNVVARDQGNPPMASIIQVTINVSNIDEQPPRFLGVCMESIFEDADPGTLIIECAAADIDEITGDFVFEVPLTYEIIDDNTNGTFRVDENGIVFLQRNVDREVVEFYSILIQARDPMGLSVTTRLNVTILDRNDNSPLVQNPILNTNITVVEIEETTTNFFTVIATDLDTGPNAVVTYSISNVFMSADATQTMLTVVVADNGTPRLSTNVTIVMEFEVPCFRQSHMINSTNGEIKSNLLCSVNILTASLNIAVGQTLNLSCSILSNIQVTSAFLHNDSDITATPGGGVVIPMTDFESTGDYTCRASSVIGNIVSPNIFVRIQVPPSIVSPPSNQQLREGQPLQLTCSASGSPQPNITWTRIINGVEETLVDGFNSRIGVFQGSLFISPAESGDRGVYTCTAANPVGAISVSATVDIFARSSVLLLQVMEFSNPNTENSCHMTNAMEFEMIMRDVTGVRTEVTNQDGSNLCGQTACSPSPCLNGGACMLQNTSSTGYDCTCPLGYRGVNCEIEVNECENELCQSGGTCTNTPGSFQCACVPGRTGHRCQFREVCSPSPCLTNQSCLLTVTNNQGYVCQDLSESTLSVTVNTNDTQILGRLDDQVNTLQENNQDPLGRRKRQVADNNDLTRNGFVTTCEARFIPNPDSTKDNNYILLWACPEGVSAPSVEQEDKICQVLFRSRMVDSCTSPTGLVLTTNSKQLPNITLTLSFIMVGSDGRPLSGREGLDLLRNMNTLSRLRDRGFQVFEFTALVPPPTTEEPPRVTNNSLRGSGVPVTTIAGVVVAVLVAFVVALAVAALIYCICRHRANKRKSLVVSTSPADNIYHLDDSFSLPHVNKLPQKSSHEDSSFTQPPSPFDDPIYGQGYVPPPLTASTQYQINPSASQRRNSFSTSEQAKRKSKNSSLKRRTESTDNLLGDDDSGDYENEHQSHDQSHDHQGPPLPPKNDSEVRKGGGGDKGTEESAIYSNIEHYHLGARGNAGERWESHQKTQTIFLPRANTNNQ